MQKILLSLCLCLFSEASIAQNPTLDSLERLLLTAPSDAQRLQWLEQMTNIALGTDFKAALGYAKRGLQLAETAGDKTWQPKFCEMRGHFHANLLQLDSAMLFFDRAMAGYSAIGDQKGQATTSFKRAWVHKKRNELPQAAAADLQALRLMEALNDQEGIADGLVQVAEDLYLQEKSAEGLQYALRSIEIAEKNGLQKQWVYSMRTAGFMHFKLREPEKALRYFDQALAKAKTLHFMPLELARLLNDRGNALKHLTRYPEALDVYRECLQIAEKHQINMAISAAWANIGEVYLKMGRYAEALPCQLKTIEMMEQNGDYYNLEENYRHISKTCEHLGNFQLALSFERKSRQLNDSTLNAQSDAKMSELRTLYETEKKEATIAAQASQLSQQRTLQWLGFGIAALLGLLALNFWRNAIARKKPMPCWQLKIRRMNCC